MSTSVKSPVTGMVWQLVAKVGDSLAEGAEIMLVESMKMEIPVAMPSAGRIIALHVKPQDMVNEGQTVATIA